MKCTGCGDENFDPLEPCPRCGALPLMAAGAPGAPSIDPAADLLGLRLEPEPEPAATGQWLPGHRWCPGSRVVRDGAFDGMLDDGAIEVGEGDLDAAGAARPNAVEDDAGPLFRIDDDLFTGYDTADPALPGRAPVSGSEPGGEAWGEPIIDRDEEVPERYWAPEVAGLGRRALALLVDLSLLLALLGVFFLGTVFALRLVGFDTGLLLNAAGVEASTLPFALLAALLGLCYFGYFHGASGCTPGKALVGIEVRTGDGRPLTWGRVFLRWFGAALGLASAGVGIFWAMFESRRRGWADLISGTVVARPRRETAVEDPRR